MAGKWKKMSNLLVDNGKKIGDAAKYTQYTTNGLRIAVERSTIPYAKVVMLAEYSGIPIDKLFEIIGSDNPSILPRVREPILPYEKSKMLDSATNPHELVTMLFEHRELLSRLIERERELQNSSGTAPK